MKPCRHAETLSGCYLCRLYETEPGYRALWDGTPLPSIRVQPTPRHPLPCIHLGALIAHEHCLCPRQDVHHCDAGHGNVRQSAECEYCPDYQEDEP